MALTNRDRIERMFTAMAPPLDDFIARVVGAEDPELGARWTDLVRAKDEARGIEGKLYDPLDPQTQFRMLTEATITRHHREGWFPFSDALGRAGETYASELRRVRNDWAHNGSFTDDDAYRALDTGERLLKLVGAPEEMERVRRLRLDLRRLSSERDDRRVRKAVADNPHSTGLRPWREVLPPHEDVATGNFAASEFAADLYKVASGEQTAGEYADPGEFFGRTYLTEGLRDLITRAVRRLGGDMNASPVINLQTNFGGGKTHSMLALWHIAAGLPINAFPQDTQEVLAGAGYTPARVRRVALVGNHFSPAGELKAEGTHVNTLWGELAWQLGGQEAYAIVADADRNRTHPGKTLHDLLARYAPAVILIDEWVAYARSLLGRNDLAGGTFDDQFTFAQSLTESVKATPGVLLAISIPASESGTDDGIVTGSAEEVGGADGLEALNRLQNVVRRVADQWRPASSTEAYHIVRQRLFTQPDPAALAAIAATARAFVDMYRQHTDEFPRETRDPAYEDRIKATYPIHPQLFDTLYEEWSTLERFQRTRGVLRLMSTVIHELWTGQDASALIMPGSIPLASGNVNAELTQYLQDSWKAIIDADVDGPESEPAKIDTARPLFGQKALTKRLARTVFFGAAPTVTATTKGILTQRVFLGTAVPGDQPGNFHSALNALVDRATYFYAGDGRYWYDTLPNITRTAKDQAERLHREDVWHEITRRLMGQARTRGDFTGVQICPDTSSDIPDVPDTRLVVLHPRATHKKNRDDSEAMALARDTVQRRGASPRTHRNSLVFLAGDETRMSELDHAVRVYLGWSHVITHSADLNLTQTQQTQADQQRSQADQTVAARLLQTFTWALVPAQPDPAEPFVIDEIKVEGKSASLAERVATKLISDDSLRTRQAAAVIRMAITKVPAIWATGHVSLGTLWNYYSQYLYMPRLRDRTVLEQGILEQPLLWTQDGFALAAAYDEQAGRYIDLWVGDNPTYDAPTPTDSLLIVQPEIATAQINRERLQSVPEGAGPTPSVGGVAVGGISPEAVEPVERVLTRYFGAKELGSARVAADFQQIVQEVLTHLRGCDGARVTVRLEVEAKRAQGFPEDVVRVVAENARTLRFDESGFEEA
ncbi:DUF499 domain-containing protein [Arsenicicoccus sp. UBA7492]|uniref:DUF499 domain-containing protein n=1 Tax=Arsenicicoccus sp. UBA7492 TaxID=1946057 RepID=UPI0025810322|nr:DUF499 domain-containing protein [Arsenicicoccus sp. UBA7492]